MTVIARPAAELHPRSSAVGRDPAVDLARAACLIVVVALHALMVGVTIRAGRPVLENALEAWGGLSPLTWFVQIMPLFFVVGGFSAVTQWSRLSANGMSASDYVGLRMRRLLTPAVVAVGVVVVTLALLASLGLPAELLAIAGFRLSQPLWFLGVYAGTTALVPALCALHRRMPVGTVVTLAALAAAVDLVRAAAGVAAIGYLNLAFVWLLIQQLGFWLADGRLPRSRMAVAAIAAAAFGTLAVSCAVGIFSFDLLTDLNPPSFALVLVGIGQLAVFELCRPVLRRMHAVRWVARVTTAINLRAMTIYLWHMLVLVLGAGALLLAGASLPVPLSAAWWGSRPLWLIGVALVVALVSWVAARWEIAGARTVDAEPIGRVRASVSPVLAMLGVVVLLASGISVAGGVLGLACIGSALALVHAAGPTTPLARMVGAPSRISSVRRPWR